MKTRKILDICEFGVHVICIKTDEKTNPYRIYHIKWYDGRKHKKLLAKYQDFYSVMYHILSLYCGINT